MSSTPSSQPPPQASASGQRILTICDDPALLALLSNAITAGGGVPMPVAGAKLLADGPPQLPFRFIVYGWDGSVEGLRLVTERLRDGAQVVGVTPPSNLAAYTKLLEDPRCNHVLTGDETGLKMVTVAVQKFVSGDLFGIEKYLPAGTTVHLSRLREYKGRTQAIDEVLAYAEEVGVRKQIRSAIGQVCEELLMNALYDAPIDKDGNPLFAEVELKARLDKLSPRPVSIRYAATETGFAVAVRDRFGRLDKATVLRYIDKCLHSSQQIDRKTYGAGLGIYLIANAASHFVLNVAPGMATEVVCTFDRKTARAHLRGLSVFVYPGPRSPRLAERSRLQREADVPERSLGAYKLVSQLAVGGMAEIYTAKTAGPGGFEKLVALKVIHPNFSEDPEFVQMLVDEAKLTVQLQHSNIVQTFDLGRVDGQYYIAMELVDGADLYKLLRRASERDMPFPIDVACFIAHEACSGLDYAHRKRDSRGRPLEIVHRDVSPQNILVSFEGDVKIADFGIAKAASRVQQTAAGVIKGKYYYMSPEQAWGDPVDARTDVFSAGILLYEMLVGQMLYLEENIDILLDKVRKAVIAPPSEKRSDVPAPLEAIVMKALAKKPQDRYPSAGDFGTALARFMRTRPPEFGKQKLAQWVRSVLEEPSDKARDVRAQTAMRRDQIAQDRNSVLFKASEAQRRQSKPPAPAVGNATSVGKPAASNSRPPARPSQVSDAPSGPRQIAVKSARPPAPKAAPRGDRATSPVEMPEARPPAPASISSGAVRTDFDDESDATIVESDRRFSERGADDSTRPMVVANLKSIIPAARLVDDPALDPADESPRPTHARARGIDTQFDVGESDSGPVPLEHAEPGAPIGPLEGNSSSGKRTRQHSDEAETAIEGMHAKEPEATAPVPMPTSSWIDPYQYRPPAAPTHSASAETWPPTPLPTAGSDLQWSPAKERSSPEMGRTSSLRPRSRVLWIFLGALALGGGVAVLPSLLHKPPPLRGTLEVVSLPAGAEVELDGKTLPTHTPIEMSDLDPRTAHHVTVSLHGFQPFAADVHFDAATPRVRLQAILVSSFGELDLRSTPPGAEVTVNGRVRGVTPLVVGELPLDKDVQVDLRLRGHKDTHRVYQFAGQKRIEAAVPLDRGR